MFKKTLLGTLIVPLTLLLTPPSARAETGAASIHDPRSRHERRTASGLPWDSNSPVAAHRSAPLGSWLCVVDYSTRRRVFVRVVDRGPYVRRRVIDLSPAAARQLGRRYGIFRVQLVR